MLTGQPLFTGEPMAVMIHHARTKPKPPSALSKAPIPERLEQIVLACLEKAPEKRPSSAIALWQQLGDVPVTDAWTSQRAQRWWLDNLPDLSTAPAPGDGSGELNVQPR